MEYLPIIILVLAIIVVAGYFLKKNKDSVKEFFGKFFKNKQKNSGKTEPHSNPGNGGNTGNGRNAGNGGSDGGTVINSRYLSGYIDQLSEYNGMPVKSFTLPGKGVFTRSGDGFAICLNREGRETETNYLLANSQHSDTVSRNAYYISQIGGHLCVSLGEKIEYNSESGDCYDPDKDRDICPICYYNGEELCHTDCLMLKDGIRFLLGNQWFLYRKDDFDEELIDDAFISRKSGNGTRRQPNSGTPVTPDSNLGRSVYGRSEARTKINGEYPFN